MVYFELKCKEPVKEDQSEILVARLAEIGFESFDLENGGLKAYIPAYLYGQQLTPLLDDDILKGIPYQVSEMADINWNEVWESNYEPVLIEEKCYIRAPFHPHRADVAYELLIEPKMSFGTAHHATTHMMISYCLAEELAGKAVLDMGCGTAVLAILAKIRGANPVLAVDNDIWAYENACENIDRNNTGDIVVMHGDVAVLQGRKFDLILANINRNILMSDLPAYAACLLHGGVLIVSGFYFDDLKMITLKAHEAGLVADGYKAQNSWTAARFMRAN
jgi:ribosomal protein L11 methyltransferase